MPTTTRVSAGGRKWVALCAALLTACQVQEPEDSAVHNEAVAEPKSRQLPIVEPPFNRGRLLLTVARVASAYSLGAEDSGVQRSLDGKQFEVRLRFGCEGPAQGTHGWSLDPDGRTLRLRAVADLTLADTSVKAVSDDSVEAAEGFWLQRPWLLQAGCPADEAEALVPVKADAESSDETPAREPERPPTAAIARVGIAQFFTAEDARTGRRTNRPFEAVKQLEAGQAAGENGFDLVLSGRLQARKDGRVISCAGSRSDRAPDCIVSADIDRVRIENPADKSVVAEWSS